MFHRPFTILAGRLEQSLRKCIPDRRQMNAQLGFQAGEKKAPFGRAWSVLILDGVKTP
jgi:hypothetical protein